MGLGVLTSAAFYGLLRALRLRRLDAGALAALALLFPASDSTRLWLGAGAVNLSILLVLLGALLALHGLRQPGKRAAVLHAGAVVLYLLGLMTYEAVAPAILVSGLLYRLRSPWRSALPRWAVDASAAVLVLAVVTSRTFYEPQPLSALGGRAVTIAVEGLAVLGAAALPFDPSQALLAAAAVVAVLAAGAFTVGASPATRPAREEVRRWLGVAAAAALAIGVGYAMYVPADASFSPASLGQHNRVNGVAGFGYVTLTYAGIAVASVLVFGGRQRWKLWSRVGVACAAVLLALGYSPRLADDQRDWVRAAREQDRVLARLDSLLHDPPSRAGLFTVGHRVATAPGVPVFAAPWDLSGAIQLRFHDPSLTAFPMVAGSRYDCTQRGVVGRSPWTPQRQETTYGRALLLDLRRGEIARVASRSDCRAVVRRFPAPVDRDAR